MEINPPDPGAFMPFTSYQNPLSSQQAVKAGIFFLTSLQHLFHGGPLIDVVKEQARVEVHMLI